MTVFILFGRNVAVYLYLISTRRTQQESVNYTCLLIFLIGRYFIEALNQKE